MARAKREIEVEYVCLGFNESDADKYRGRMVKSIKGGLYVDGRLTEIIDVSGMTEAQRTEFYDHQYAYIGNVFTARGRGLFDSGKLRNPQFIGFRSDKNATECTLDNVRAMLEFDLALGF